MKKGKVSNAVIRRLPRYYGQLDSLYQVGVVRISSSALGKAMNLTASQIRQDLSCFGEFGQQGYGYNVKSLMTEIADIMGMNKGHTAVVVGAGRLGRALLANFPFGHYGVTLTGYLQQVRITHAKMLLRFSDKKIEAIGLECGFGELTYFSRVFKKVEGVSPREYRRLWQSAAAGVGGTHG